MPNVKTGCNYSKRYSENYVVFEKKKNELKEKEKKRQILEKKYRNNKLKEVKNITKLENQEAVKQKSS